MAQKHESRLGRNPLGGGLSVLLDVDAQPQGGSSISEIEIEKIEANPNQPRTQFDEDKLNELAESIKNIGIISPITLRKIDDNHYQIIAGERRWRAAKLAGIEKLPAYIKTADDEKHVQLMALIENIQREDLNAIEVALSYDKLMNDYNLTQEELSAQVGKKRATIANYVRLLKLPAGVQLGLKDHKIEMGHARVLVGIESAADQLALYERIVDEGLSVRAVEELSKELKPVATTKPVVEKKLRVAHKEVSARLTRKWGTKVQVVSDGKGVGSITIAFSTNDEMNQFVSLLDK